MWYSETIYLTVIVITYTYIWLYTYIGDVPLGKPDNTDSGNRIVWTNFFSCLWSLLCNWICPKFAEDSHSVGIKSTDNPWHEHEPLGGHCKFNYSMLVRAKIAFYHWKRSNWQDGASGACQGAGNTPYFDTRGKNCGLYTYKFVATLMICVFLHTSQVTKSKKK
jgi:hypothetical protein